MKHYFRRLISSGRTIIHEFQKTKISTFINSVITTLGIQTTENTYYLKNGVLLKYSPETLDVMVIRECFIKNAYSKLLKERELNTVMDFGAHKGYFILGLLNSGISINTAVCVEPLSENITYFKENIALNNKTLMKKIKHLTLEESAISSINGKAKFYITQDSVGHSLIDPSSDERKVISTRQVSLITPELLYKKNKIISVDLLKMDIEGEEFSLFSSKQLRFLIMAKYIVMEIHPKIQGKVIDIPKLLKSYGYRIEIPNPAWPDLIFAQKI